MCWRRGDDGILGRNPLLIEAGATSNDGRVVRNALMDALGVSMVTSTDSGVTTDSFLLPGISSGPSEYSLVFFDNNSDPATDTPSDGESTPIDIAASVNRPWVSLERIPEPGAAALLFRAALWGMGGRHRLRAVLSS